MENMENRVTYISVDPGRSFPGRVGRISSLSGPIQAKSFDEMSTDLSNIRKSLDINAGRLRLLEERKRARVAVKPEKIQEQVRIDQEAADNAWVEGMLALGGQGKGGGDISEVRKELHQQARDRDLSPREAKAKYREEQEDEAWVKEMLALGGQEKE